MKQRTFDDPVLELAMRFGDGPEAVLDLADVTDADAEIALGVLDEVEAEEQAASIVATLRGQGHTL
jgi:hypothetical protein